MGGEGRVVAFQCECDTLPADDNILSHFWLSTKSDYWGPYVNSLDIYSRRHPSCWWHNTCSLLAACPKLASQIPCIHNSQSTFSPSLNLGIICKPNSKQFHVSIKSYPHYDLTFFLVLPPEIWPTWNDAKKSYICTPTLCTCLFCVQCSTYREMWLETLPT
jgi:hypothetical protein